VGLEVYSVYYTLPGYLGSKKIEVYIYIEVYIEVYIYTCERVGLAPSAHLPA
jgi:hypothetical protein